MAPHFLRPVVLASALSLCATALVASEAGAAKATGGTLRVEIPSETTSLDPARCPVSQASGAFLQYAAIYGYLMYEDTKGAVRPWLARSLRTSDRGTTWTLRLHKGAKFSDGTDLTAGVVRFGWERMRDPSVSSVATAAGVNATFKSLEATDPLTLRIVLNTQNAQFPHSLAGIYGCIGSQAAIQKQGTADFSVHPVGAGPFVLKEWTQGTRYRLSRNTTYWDAPRPAVDELEILPSTDRDKTLDAWKTGQAEMMWTSFDADVKEAKAAGGRYVAMPQLGGTGYAFNLSLKPVDDPQFRKALIMALDPAELTKASNPGGIGSKPAHGLIDPSFPFSDDKAVWWKGWPKPDLAGAQKLVDDYVARTRTDPVNVTITIVSGSAVVAPTELVRDAWQKLNHVRVQLDVVPLATFVVASAAGRIMVGATSLPGQNWDSLYQFHTAPAGQLPNTFRYSNPKVDSELDRARQTTSRPKQIATYHEVANQLVEDVPMYLYRYGSHYWVSKPNVKGVTRMGESSFRPDLVQLTAKS